MVFFLDPRFCPRSDAAGVAGEGSREDPGVVPREPFAEEGGEEEEEEEGEERRPRGHPTSRRALAPTVTTH